MMHIIMLTLIAAMDATQLHSLAADDVMKGFASSEPQNPADAVNSMIDDMMAQIQPVLQQKLALGIDKFKKGVAFNIDVSPNLALKLNIDLAGRHSYENNVIAHGADLADVHDGAMAVAQFANSLHDNNNVVAKSDVIRLNGVGSDDTDQSTSSMMNDAVNSVTAPNASQSSSATQSSLAIVRTKRSPPSLRETILSNASKSFLSVQRSSADAILSIRVSPVIKIDVMTNMTGAYSNSFNALSENGRVQRVTGAMAVANFSGALHDNNMAVSLDGEAQRINGADVSSTVDFR